MKNNKKTKFDIVCHMGDISYISNQISIIHAEAVINHLDRTALQNNDKHKLLEEIIKFGN